MAPLEHACMHTYIASMLSHEWCAPVHACHAGDDGVARQARQRTAGYRHGEGHSRHACPLPSRGLSQGLSLSANVCVRQSARCMGVHLAHMVCSRCLNVCISAEICRNDGMWRAWAAMSRLLACPARRCR